MKLLSEIRADIELSLDEVKKKKVVRDGKVVRKVVCKPGFKAKGNKCVKMDATEKRTRTKASKKAVRSKKGKSTALASRKRAKSMKKLKR